VARSSYAQQRAKERIADVARQGHDLVTFWREATDAIAPVVPFYLTPCFYTIDPASLLATSHYHGDLTRTVVVGEIPEEIRRMHAAVLQALDAGIESIRAGVAGRDIHHTVCQILVDRGYGTTTKGFEGREGGAKMNHGTGHAIGLDIHEEPTLRGQNEEALQEGDVVTVEPGLYLLGLGGVRVEDAGMVTGNGFANFTTLTRSLDPKDYL